LLFKSQKIDATKGPLLKMLLLYSIPVILSLLVQTLFNAIDIFVLSAMADSRAIASVGATATIIHLMVNAFIGIAGGTKILLARYIGAQENSKIRQTVSTSMILSVLLGVLIAVLGIIFAPHMLRLTDCPAECFDGAVLYIRIYIAAAPFIMFYNFGASVITASGDTQRPLYYIIAGGALNVILNVLLCFLIPEKVAAVAIATAAAQILSAVLVGIRLTRIRGALRLRIKHLTWSFEAFGRIMRFGIPLFLTQILLPLANLQMQSAINSYGVSAVAGNSASGTLEAITSAFVNGFSSSVPVFVGQNLGAGNISRAKKSFWNCLWLGAAVGLLMGLFFNLTARFWFGLLLEDDALAVEYAVKRQTFSLIYWLVAIDYALSNTVQTLGGAVFTAVNSAVCIFGLRLVWMNFIYPIHPSFFGIINCFIASWIIMLFTNTAAYLYYNNRMKKGQLAKI